MSVHFKVQEPMYVHACINEKQILLSKDSRKGRYSSNGTIHPVRCSSKDVSKGLTDERECTYNGTLYYLPYSFSSIKCDDVPTKLFWKNLSRNMESVSSFSAAVDNAVPQTFLLVSHHLRLASLILPISKDKIDGKKAGFANCCAVVLTRDGGPRMLFGGFPDKVSKYAYAGHPDSSGKVVTLENVITTEVFRLLRDWCSQLSANVHVIVARHANSMHNAPMRIVDRFSRSPLDSTLTLLGQAQATVAGTSTGHHCWHSRKAVFNSVGIVYEIGKAKFDVSLRQSPEPISAHCPPHGRCH